MFYNAKFIKIKDHSTAATSAVTSDAVDTAGYECCTFLTSFGTAATDNTVKVQQSSDDAATDTYADLEGTSVTSGSSDEDIVVTIVKPRERYLKFVATRGTSSTLESIWAILHGPVRSLPVDNTTSGTITGELHVSPAEGTA